VVWVRGVGGVMHPCEEGYVSVFRDSGACLSGRLPHKCGRVEGVLLPEQLPMPTTQQAPTSLFRRLWRWLREK
jgi:hypothetical protein